MDLSMYHYTPNIYLCLKHGKLDMLEELLFENSYPILCQLTRTYSTASIICIMSIQCHSLK